MWGDWEVLCVSVGAGVKAETYFSIKVDILQNVLLSCKP